MSVDAGVKLVQAVALILKLTTCKLRLRFLRPLIAEVS